MPGSPLTADERAELLELMGQGLTRNEVAKRSGRSASTVTRVAREVGHDFTAAQSAKTQAKLEAAHAARSAYSAERRAAIAARLTEEAELLLEQLHQPHRAFNFGGRDNTFAEATLDEPPVDAKRALVQSAEIALRTVLNIDKHDNRASEGGAEIDQWLDHMGVA